MSNSTLEAISPNYRSKFPVKIAVTQSHIDCGRRFSCNACPVALALFERLGEYWAVGQSRLMHCATGYEIRTPPAAELFIFNFDNFQGTAPFEFSLEIPLALLPNDDSFLKEKACA